jgi:hypothetical protein
MLFKWCSHYEDITLIGVGLASLLNIDDARGALSSSKEMTGISSSIFEMKRFIDLQKKMSFQINPLIYL